MCHRLCTLRALGEHDADAVERGLHAIAAEAAAAAAQGARTFERLPTAQALQSLSLEEPSRVMARRRLPGQRSREGRGGGGVVGGVQS